VGGAFGCGDHRDETVLNLVVDFRASLLSSRKEGRYTVEFGAVVFEKLCWEVRERPYPVQEKKDLSCLLEAGCNLKE